MTLPPALFTRCTALLLWLALLPGLATAAGDDSGMRVERADTRLEDGVYRLDAYISFQLSEAVLEAVNNGVPLTFALEMEVSQQRDWWLDKTVARVVQRYRLRYHALSRHYLLTNLNTGARHNFVTLTGALDLLGTLEDFPLVDASLLPAEDRYNARLRSRLDMEELPTPLRVVAYLSRHWRLDSPWQQWPLTP